MDIVRLVEGIRRWHHYMVPVSLGADNLHTPLDYSYNLGDFAATRLAVVPTLAAAGLVDRPAAAAWDCLAAFGDMFAETARVDTKAGE